MSSKPGAGIIPNFTMVAKTVIRKNQEWRAKVDEARKLLNKQIDTGGIDVIIDSQNGIHLTGVIRLMLRNDQSANVLRWEVAEQGLVCFLSDFSIREFLKREYPHTWWDKEDKAFREGLILQVYQIQIITDKEKFVCAHIVA